MLPGVTHNTKPVHIVLQRFSPDVRMPHNDKVLREVLQCSAPSVDALEALLNVLVALRVFFLRRTTVSSDAPE
jgi:hypothetical protein